MILLHKKEILPEEIVMMSLGGWSNVHNEPLIYTSVIKMFGNSFHTSTIDSSEHSDTVDYFYTWQNIPSYIVKKNLILMFEASMLQMS